MATNEVLSPDLEITVSVAGEDMLLVAFFATGDGGFDVALGYDNPDALVPLADALTHAAGYVRYSGTDARAEHDAGETSSENGEGESDTPSDPPWDAFRGIGQ